MRETEPKFLAPSGREQSTWLVLGSALISVVIVWLVGSQFIHSATVLAAMTIVGLWFSQRVLVQNSLDRILFAPEGGRLPKGYPRAAIRFDKAVRAAKATITSFFPEQGKMIGVVLRGDERVVREAAFEAARSGAGSYAQIVLARRRECVGATTPERVEAWNVVLEAAEQGLADGEAARRSTPRLASQADLADADHLRS